LGGLGEAPQSHGWLRPCSQSSERRRREDGDAEGAEVVEFLGKWCPPPSRVEGLGERRELPQRGPAGAPAANAFWAYFRASEAF